LLCGEISSLERILGEDPNGEAHLLQDLMRVDRFSIVDSFLIPLFGVVGEIGLRKRSGRMKDGEDQTLSVSSRSSSSSSSSPSLSESMSGRMLFVEAS